MAQETREKIYERAGLGHRLGFGKRPALVVVDLQLGCTLPERSPVAADLGSQIEAVNAIMAAARHKGVPIFFTAIGYEPDSPQDGGLWVQKISTLRKCLLLGTEMVELDPRLERRPEDILLIKKYASAFFGTPLASTLAAEGIDTLIVTGCTTSGCIRATVIDAISYGFRPIIPIEGVGDRAQDPHEANLFDIGSKYGDVVSLEEVLHYLEELPA